MTGHGSQLMICNLERDVELSNRIARRNRTKGQLEIMFDPRPVQTKYRDLPILDAHPEATVPLHLAPTYKQDKTFFAGDAPGPWSGFSSNIDTESSLRSQFFALQTCEQSEYVPSSQSDMYVPLRLSSIPEEKTVDRVNGNTARLACGNFNHSTRVDRLNSGCTDCVLGNYYKMA